jgi:hypothetical protein
MGAWKKVLFLLGKTTYDITASDETLKPAKNDVTSQMLNVSFLS